MKKTLTQKVSLFIVLGLLILTILQSIFSLCRSDIFLAVVILGSTAILLIMMHKIFFIVHSLNNKNEKK